MLMILQEPLWTSVIWGQPIREKTPLKVFRIALLYFGVSGTNAPGFLQVLLVAYANFLKDLYILKNIH